MPQGAATTSGSSGAGLDIFSCSADQLNSVTLAVGGDGAVASSICSTLDVQTLGVQGAVLVWLVQQQKDQQQTIIELQYGLDTAFLLSSAYQVFTMQTGFALYTAGVVRGKNVIMILLKNFMDCCIASISFYLIGYAFGFGVRGSGNGFIGDWDFALSGVMQASPAPYAYWFWNWAFAAASTTILSGSIAERATFHAYMLYSAFQTTFVYPVVAHWLWSPKGWLSPYTSSPILGSGAMDFAGSGVVHMVGGFSSLMGSIATGARVGRFDTALPASAFRGNSPALYVLGTLMLWFGWYGFNPGSNQAIHNYVLASNVARTAVTTTLAAGAGAVATLMLAYWRTHTWDLLQVCTGALAGLVAVTSGCCVVTPWAAIIAGTVAAPIYVYAEVLLEVLQIDDPVGAWPVHGACGMWGMLFVGLFAKEQYVTDVYAKEHLSGILYGGHGQILLCQVIAMAVIIAWTCFWMASLFWLLDWAGVLRVSLVQEAMGMDRALCGGVHGPAPDPTEAKFGSSRSYTSSSSFVLGLSQVNASSVNGSPKFRTVSGLTVNPLSGAMATITEETRALGEDHTEQQQHQQSAAPHPAGQQGEVHRYHHHTYPSHPAPDEDGLSPLSTASRHSGGKLASFFADVKPSTLLPTSDPIPIPRR